VGDRQRATGARKRASSTCETLGPLLQWIVENLGDDLSVETLAKRNHMSARTFAHSVDWIADEVGFGNAATLRHHFGRVRGLSPQQYRRRFAG
jgi:transcriptional regulator GlxA family with amidase domain